MILDSPAAARNADSILAALSEVLDELAGKRKSSDLAPGDDIRVLEIASGSGQHVERFAAEFPKVHWQPSEPEPSHRAAIDVRIKAAELKNVAPALALDARDDWPQEWFDLVMAVNLVHISPWEVTEALIAKSAATLGDSGLLMLYGPYRQGGRHNSQGNVDFDADLRAA